MLIWPAREREQYVEDAHNACFIKVTNDDEPS